MLYSLHDLLSKMGAPEVKDRGRMEWHYFDKKKNALAGFAEIRLEAGGERLIAEMRHLHENYSDDEGRFHAQYTESFYFAAERSARPGHYRILKLALDGDEYGEPSKGLTELGLSVFHARALDISIRMMEQVFNKQDILEPAGMPETFTVTTGSKISPAPRFRAAAKEEAVELPRERYGVVIPFRPRSQVSRANA